MSSDKTIVKDPWTGDEIEVPHLYENVAYVCLEEGCSEIITDKIANILGFTDYEGTVLCGVCSKAMHKVIK